MNALDREGVHQKLFFNGSFFRLNRFFFSAIDFCLWDIAGKAFEQPIYKVAGGYRETLRAYASSMAYTTIEEYLEDVQKAADLGFTAFKLHGFNVAKKDIELCEAVRAKFPKMDFMLDCLCAYNLKEALAVGRVLDRCGFYWYEDPMREENHEGYAILRQKIDTPVASTELNQIGLLDYQNFIKMKSTDIVRTFGDYMGGITPMLKTAHMCEAFFLKCEPHSFGPALIQAAHFHVMLSIHNCDFFEAPVPEGILDFGMKEGIKVDKKGYVSAPTKPGIGYDIDFDWIDDNLDRIF